jgi:hypothetical protein
MPLVHEVIGYNSLWEITDFRTVGQWQPQTVQACRPGINAWFPQPSMLKDEDWFG